MRPHFRFFHSLEQVEKRIKLENLSSPSSLQEVNHTASESLSSPLHLNVESHLISNGNSISTSSESELPLEFLSNPLKFAPNDEDAFQSNISEKRGTVVEASVVDDIELLMLLLGLSDCEGQDKEEAVGVDFMKGGCDERFLGKIAGIKGPKCGKHLDRLEGWIGHFFSTGDVVERREPFRLAHLLLGKAAFVSDSSDGSFDYFEFPSTISEFLQSDPPAK